MKQFRSTFFRRLFVLGAGITFLNMSFILAEIAMLDLSKKYETLVQNILRTGIEEEKESSTEGGELEETSKEIDLSLNQHLAHHHLLYEVGCQRNKTLTHLTIKPGFVSIFSPPPEFC